MGNQQIDSLTRQLEIALQKHRIWVSIHAKLPNYCLILQLTPKGDKQINLEHTAKLLQRELNQLAIPNLREVRVRYKSYEQKFTLTSPTKPKQAQTSHGLDTEAWRSLGIGIVLALIIFHVPFLSTAFHGFPLAVHELGHTVTHWLFGRPALPTIDFAFGGGIVLVAPQSPILLVLIYGGLTGLGYFIRQYSKLLIVLAVTVALYTYCLMTVVNQMLAVAMGHGLEVVAIFWCFYCFLGKYFCRFTGERTIYAMLGCFTALHSCRFAWNIVRDITWKTMYLSGKGGLLDHDFVILARQYFGTDYTVVANWFLALYAIAPVLAVVCWRTESTWQKWLASLWE